MTMAHPSPRHRRRLVAGALVVATVATATASAATSPSVTPEARTVAAGERYALYGASWSRAEGCEARIEISQRLGHGVLVGTAPIAQDGTFSFFRRVPRAARSGTRMVLDATQFCRATPEADRLGTTRTVTLRVVPAPRPCPSPIAVDEKAYAVSVIGKLGCDRAIETVGAFIDTGIDPSGFDCSHVDPRTGHDFVCLADAHPERRVIAKHVREV